MMKNKLKMSKNSKESEIASQTSAETIRSHSSGESHVVPKMEPGIPAEDRKRLKSGAESTTKEQGDSLGVSPSKKGKVGRPPKNQMVIILWAQM